MPERKSRELVIHNIYHSTNNATTEIIKKHHGFKKHVYIHHNYDPAIDKIIEYNRRYSYHVLPDINPYYVTYSDKKIVIDYMYKDKPMMSTSTFWILFTLMFLLFIFCACICVRK